VPHGQDVGDVGGLGCETGQVPKSVPGADPLATAATSMAARLFSCANEKSQVTLRFCAANRKQ